jgi:hypothetical protein
MCNVSRFLPSNCHEVSNSVSMAINFQGVLRCGGGTHTVYERITVIFTMDRKIAFHSLIYTIYGTYWKRKEVEFVGCN